MALRVCEAKGLLFHELMGKLGEIARRYGDEAAWRELAIQAAVINEKASVEQEQTA